MSGGQIMYNMRRSMVTAFSPISAPNSVEPWCVLLPSRLNAASSLRDGGPTATLSSVLRRDSLADSLRRAETVTQLEHIAMVATQARGVQGHDARKLRPANIFVQPSERGTAHEILLALMRLETHIPHETPVLFLPSDHVVGDEEVFTRSLGEMIDWICRDPKPVYLLGASPEGPHDRLGYIVPWYDAMNTAAGVYDFVEEPDVRQARKLIHAGGLWNTFIFGSALGSLIELFPPEYDGAIRSMRAALKENNAGPVWPNELRALYSKLSPKDFSQDILSNRKDFLNVLRMPRCGWWPLKAPRQSPQGATSAFQSRRI
jgi:mannose-1-phosphate guanylyltransferase